MGYGVAWADRNIGATAIGMTGDYFNWGDILSEPFADVVYEVNSMSVGQLLPAEDDAATVNIGTNWHIPSDAEWTALINGANYSAGRFVNKADNTQYIIMPKTGYYEYFDGDSNYSGAYLTGANYGFCWTSQLHSKQTGTYDFLSSAGLVSDMEGSVDIYDGYIYLAAPIRAIYAPSFSTCTLTINIGSYQYKYICESGQKVTVTAIPSEGYEFDQWLEDANTDATRTFTVKGNATYTATFKENTTPTYTIVWKNADGKILETDNNVAYGARPEYNGATPTKNEDAQYTYTFSGWTPDLREVTEDETYTATYTANLRSYTITFFNGDGTVLESNTFAYGTTPVCTATPTKNSTQQYNYIFSGWTPAIESVTGEQTYTPLFTEQTRQYTVAGNSNDDSFGNVTGSGTYDYNTQVTLTANPEYGYRFVEWQEDHSTINPRVFNLTEDVTLTAVFEVSFIPSLTLKDNETGDYYDNFHNDYAGRAVEEVIYERTFKANTWSTVCMPFYVDADNMSGAGWFGSVFEFTHAVVNGDISDGGVYLYFKPAKSMEAGKGYLVYSKTEISGPFFFYDITIDTSADTEEDITSINGYNDGVGTIELVGTLRKGTLTSNSKSQMILKDNKIWFPGSGTTSVRAYRGFFKDRSGNAIPPRAHIVVEGSMENEQWIVDNGNVRKFIDNGVLIIERNGVKYDAQGKRL